MSSNTIVSGPSRTSAGDSPPAKASTRMPAARAACTPERLSSTTTQPAGSVAIRSAACRKRSGAGLPLATSSALKIRPSKRSYRPVSPSV